jgi:hypothetical protein
LSFFNQDFLSLFFFQKKKKGEEEEEEEDLPRQVRMSIEIFFETQSHFSMNFSRAYCNAPSYLLLCAFSLLSEHST